MPDYIREIQNGTMMIRDTGGDVQFWFKTGSSTFNNQQDWGRTVDGNYQGFEYRLARGGAWQMFGSAYVGTRQEVMFRIVGEGLGWPTTDFVQFIERSRQPDVPQQPYLVDLRSDALRVAFNYNYDGGLPLNDARMWFSYDDQPRNIVGGRDSWIYGLSPKTYYTVWGDVRNDHGWSGLGPPVTLRTIGVPDRPEAPNIYAISPTQVRGAFRSYPWDGGVPVLEWQIGWGTNPTTPQTLTSGDIGNFNNLQAAKQYYFWGRGRNAVGWGPWSARTDVLLPAGARVRQSSGVWARALPWVKTNGVWKIARPYSKKNGTWRPTKS